MKLDEAIKHAEEVAKHREDEIPFIEQGIKDGYDFPDDLENCIKCAEEHRQLAEWLKELKKLKQTNTAEWIMTDKGIKVTRYKCSACGRTVCDDTGYDVVADYPYCHCGCRMKGENQ